MAPANRNRRPGPNACRFRRRAPAHDQAGYGVADLPTGLRRGLWQTEAMAENKTAPTDVPVDEFLAGIEHPVRRADGEALLDLMHQCTGEEPLMWGPSMVGFGSYHYKYASGREGDSLAVGFSPRKPNLALYGLTYAPGSAKLLARLGKHKTGAACLYINKLADVGLDVLRELVTLGYRFMTTHDHESLQSRH